MRNLCLLVCLFYVSMLWAAEAPKPKTTERLLTTVPRSCLSQLHVMEQGNAVLYPVKRGAAQYLALNANLGSAFDAMNMDSLQISADGYHYAVVATIKGKQCVVVDGKPGEFYASILHESLALGERGEYVQYVARETSGQSRKVIIDLAEGGIYRSTAFDEIRPHSAIIAANGTASAYIARIGKQWCPVMLDKPGKLYDDIGQASFSHDGKRLYFTALIGGQWQLVSPRTNTAFLYSYDEMSSLIVSPDNQAVMYAVRTGNRWNIIRYAEIIFPEGATDLPIIGADGRERYRLKFDPKIKRPPLEQALTQQPFDAVGGYGFLADGTFVYTARRGTQWSLVRGDTINGPYESLDAPLFNTKMNQVFCKAKQDGQWYLLAGAKKYGPYEAIGSVTFSPKGDHVVYSAIKGGQWCVGMDGIDGESFTAVEAPVWSPDGARMAYVVKKGELYGVVQDGKLKELYDAVSQLSFSRSGRQVAFAAQTVGKWRVLVGNAASAPYDIILDRSIVVDQEGGQPQTTQMGTVYTPLTLHYLAARLSAKKIVNEEAFDVYYVKEMRFE